MVAPLFDLFELFGIYYTNTEFADWLANGPYMQYHFDLRINSIKGNKDESNLNMKILIVTSIMLRLNCPKF